MVEVDGDEAGGDEQEQEPEEREDAQGDRHQQRSATGANEADTNRGTVRERDLRGSDGGNEGRFYGPLNGQFLGRNQVGALGLATPVAELRVLDKLRTARAEATHNLILTGRVMLTGSCAN